MLNSSIILSLFVGIIAVLQAAINKEMIKVIGLNWTLLIGSVVTLLIASIVFIIAKKSPHLLPTYFKVQQLELKWWFLIPGIFGFIFIFALPISFSEIGAVKTIICMIAAQMITSVLWDTFVDGIVFNTAKGFGVVLALASVLVITLS